MLPGFMLDRVYKRNSEGRQRDRVYSDGSVSAPPASKPTSSEGGTSPTPISCDPVTAITLGLGIVSTIGSIGEGIDASQKNSQAIEMQRRAMEDAKKLAEELANSVTRASYDQMAASDIQAAIKAVSEAAQATGTGRGGTQKLAAVAGAAGTIRSQYGQAFNRDRLAAQQAAGQLLGSVASTKPLGFNEDPFGGVGASLSGLAQSFANTLGKPGAQATPPGGFGGAAPAIQVPGWGTPGSGTFIEPPAGNYPEPSLIRNPYN